MGASLLAMVAGQAIKIPQAEKHWGIFYALKSSDRSHAEHGNDQRGENLALMHLIPRRIRLQHRPVIPQRHQYK
ncbi:hypothetical protein EMIT0P294_30347 [Pseudomonas sp. IT-P294]